jgi:GntR family transcriptional regulator
MRATKETADLTFLQTMRPDPFPGLPKYLHLRETLITAIEGGHWKPGAKLPTEAELTGLTPYSLGTVQRAMRSLVDDGVVVRRKGQGSFVARNRKTMDDPWHFRFPGDDGESLLPLDIKVRSVESVGADGPWAQFLGREDAYVQINRLVNVGHEFIILSQFFLSAARFGDLLDVRAKDLDGVPIRVVLRERYDMPTLRVVERVGCETLPDEVCHPLGLHPGSIGMVCEILGYGYRDQPVSYQLAYLPPDTRRMEVRETKP